MEKFSIKNIILVLVYTSLFFVSLYIYNIWPHSYLGRVNIVDYSLRVSLRYSFPLLVFILPIRRLSLKLLVYTGVLFLLGFLMHLTPLPDIEPVVYIIFYFPIGLIATAVLHFILVSKYTQSIQVTGTLIFVCLVVLIFFSYFSVIWTKSTIHEYTKFYVYDYLRCNGESLHPEAFKNICQNLAGPFWKPYYQNICLAQVDSLKNSGKLTKDFQACYSFEIYKNQNSEISDFLMNYWNLKPIIGLPQSS